ncbi:XkdN-like protein [Brevibacillus sp. M2.1A]|uniref:phage tail assembly chaperone n=1 Tax=Brevibacillus sp. M2.1A TaxID=2738980 RepID=UPI00156AE3D5|nr:XkdN-like protein [Brevibacillus sp. M2.1A]MCC8435482.1 XkdN-like protein [Brevibacillus sp. M2.1A]
MSTLQDFLNANPVDNLTDEVYISERFKDKDGNPFLFKIRAMTNREFNDIRKRATKIKGRKAEFDAEAFNKAIVIEHTIVPDFKNVESLKSLGCATPDQYLERVLLSGEVVELASQIQKLSGFDTEMETLVEEAKN